MGGFDQGYQQPADVGSAFSWAFSKFGKNAGSAIVAMLLWALIILAVSLLGFLVLVPLVAATEFDYTESGFTAAASLTGIGAVVFFFLLYFVAFLSQIAMINGYLTVADGQRQVSLSDFFKFKNLGAGLLTALIIAGVSSLLQFVPVLGWIGSIVVSFLTIYALYFVVDTNQDAISALRSSIEVASKNVGQTILLVLATWLVIAVGMMLCGVGVIFAGPIAGLLMVYMYRRLTGRPVSPAI